MTMHHESTNGKRPTQFATSAARIAVLEENAALDRHVQFQALQAAHNAENLLTVIAEAIEFGYGTPPLERALDRVAFLAETVYYQAIQDREDRKAPQDRLCSECNGAGVNGLCPHCTDGTVPF